MEVLVLDQVFLVDGLRVKLILNFTSAKAKHIRINQEAGHLKEPCGLCIGAMLYKSLFSYTSSIMYKYTTPSSMCLYITNRLCYIGSSSVLLGRYLISLWNVPLLDTWNSTRNRWAIVVKHVLTLLDSIFFLLLLAEKDTSSLYQKNLTIIQWVHDITFFNYRMLTQQSHVVPHQWLWSRTYLFSSLTAEV